MAAVDNEVDEAGEETPIRGGEEEDNHVDEAGAYTRSHFSST